jgi:hypothetical protein
MFRLASPVFLSPIFLNGNSLNLLPLQKRVGLRRTVDIALMTA